MDFEREIYMWAFLVGARSVGHCGVWAHFKANVHQFDTLLEPKLREESPHCAATIERYTQLGIDGTIAILR